MTIASHTAIRNNTKRRHVPFALFSSMVTPCITMVEYNNQEVSMDTIHLSYWDFPSFVCTIACIYLVLCQFITCVDSCNPPESRYTIVLSPRIYFWRESSRIYYIVNTILFYHHTSYSYRPIIWSLMMLFMIIQGGWKILKHLASHSRKSSLRVFNLEIKRLLFQFINEYIDIQKYKSVIDILFYYKSLT